MIGWRCSVFRTNNDIELEGTDPSAINYDEKNRAYAIYQTKSEALFNRIKSANEAFTYLEKNIGDEIYKIWSIPFSHLYQTPFERFIDFIPSSRLMYPSLIERALADNTTYFYNIIYIPSLKRVVKSYHPTSVGDSLVRSTIYKIIDNTCVKMIEIQHPSAQVMATYSGKNFTVTYNSFFFGDFTQESFDIQENYATLQLLYNSKQTPSTPYLVNYIVNASDSGAIDFFKNLFSDFSNPDWGTPDNPYEPGGPSGSGGGNGSFDDDSDQITDSSLPTISSANTGFTRIYNPSLSQVQDLARYLWTDTSVIDTIWNHIKQFFENPMEAIIGFNLVPVPVPNGGTQNFALMYIDTGVAMTVAASQFVDVDCGTLELKEYYGSALDYSPNTKVSCFLPFIGTVSLNTDEVMGRTLQVKYRVDICSGSCVAKIAIDGNFIYQYSGHCAINIPISAADFSSYVSSAISVAKLAGGALAAGAAGVVGAGAAEAVQQTNQVVTTTQITNTARNPATGRQITTGTTTRVETRESPTDQSSTQASFSGLTPQNIANTVGQIMTSKPSIEHSGSFSGNSGYLGIRRPFLIIERPNMCMPANFQALNGFPSMITLELSTCKGFTRVQQVQLTGLSATNPEQAEILQLLKSGVVM